MEQPRQLHDYGWPAIHWIACRALCNCDNEGSYEDQKEKSSSSPTKPNQLVEGYSKGLRVRLLGGVHLAAFTI